MTLFRSMTVTSAIMYAMLLVATVFAVAGYMACSSMIGEGAGSMITYLLPLFVSVAIAMIIGMAVARGIEEKIADLQQALANDKPIASINTDDSLGLLSRAIAEQAKQESLTVKYTPEQLKTFQSAVSTFRKGQEQGDTAARINTSNIDAVYRPIAEEINGVLDQHATIGKKMLSSLNEIGKGNINAPIEKLPGSYADTSKAIENIRDSILLLSTEVTHLTASAMEGRLSSRGNADRHQGEYKKVVESLNAAFEHIAKPILTTTNFVQSVASGVIPPKIQGFTGECEPLMNALNHCSATIESLVDQGKTVSRNVSAGNLRYRFDDTALAGVFADIAIGFNKSMEGVLNLIDNLPIPAMAIDNDFNILYMNELGASLNNKKGAELNGSKCFNHFRTSQCNTPDCACFMTMQAGQPKTQETDAHPGVHNLEIKYSAIPIKDDSGKTIGAFEVVIDQTEVKNNLRLNDKVALYQQRETDKIIALLKRMAEGDFSMELSLAESDNDTSSAHKRLNSILSAVTVLRSSIQELVVDAKMLTLAAAEGRLSTRADASKHKGDFRVIVDGVNKTLDNVINPLNVAADYVDKISKGEIPSPITDTYHGDFNIIKENLNECIRAVNFLVSDAKMLALAAAEGRLSTRADASKHKGDFRVIVEGVNKTLDNVIDPLNVAADYVDRISRGEIPSPITDTYHGDFNIIKENLNECIRAVNFLVSDAKMLALAAAEGRLSTRADASKHNGDFRVIVEGVNKTLDDVIGPLNVAADYVARIARGDIPPVITDNYNGDFNIIKENLNTCVNNLNRFSEDIGELVLKASHGDLNARGDTSSYQGDWASLLADVNALVEAMVTPIHESIEVLSIMATGDLTPRVEGSYEGDFAQIKEAINSLGDSLSSVLSEVINIVTTTASATSQISASIEEISAGTQMQSQEAADVASAVEEMNSTVMENSRNASVAATVAQEAGTDAEEGGKVVESTIKGMSKIAEVVSTSANLVQDLGKSSEQIGKIIHVIDEIADQTNLLALNAAIEAARAGEQGRGFAVVADEVRKLAERTSSATKEIEEMIASIQEKTRETVKSMNKGTVQVEEGTELAHQAGDSLRTIIDRAHRVVDYVTQVATASEQQSSATTQIARSIENINNVVGESNLGMQQIAIAAEDLNKLTNLLKESVDRFTIADNGTTVSNRLSSSGKVAGKPSAGNTIGGGKKRKLLS